MFKINLKKFSLMRGGSFLGFGLSPHRDWRIVLTGFAILVLLVLGMSSLVFYRTNSNSGSAGVQVESSPRNTLNLERLKKTVDYYKDKETKFEEIKSTKGNLLDPSI